MERNLVVLLFALAIFASGCTGGGNSSDETAADHSLSCSALRLDIAYANGEKVDVVNLGKNSFGNVTVTWNYANSGKITKSLNTPEAGETETFRSGSSGTLKSASVIHEDCPSRTDSY